MFIRTATAAAGLTIAGMAFTAGIGAGVALVGGACLARKAMKRRKDWRDDHDHIPTAEALADELGPTPGANPI